MNSKTNDRRGFLHGVLAAGSLAAAAPRQRRRNRRLAAGNPPFLPAYTRAQNYKSLKQSSYDRTGGNSDRWPVAAGPCRRCSTPPARRDHAHLVHYCGAQQRSSERAGAARLLGRQCQTQRRSPGGDFFGLNLGIYQIYESSIWRARRALLNCYFAMPYKRSAVHGDE